MKFGLRYCNTARYVDAKEAVALAQAAETAGFESLWTVEHTIVPAGYASAYPYDPSGKMAGGRDDMPLPDPLIWMAFVAAATTKIKLATGILILPQHNPVLAAKQIATLDHMSRGRILLGVGVGWLQEEFAALGVPFAERGARMDEYISAMRELWSADKPTFKGRFVAFEGAYCRPQPVNKSVPIIVGGHSEAAARRAGTVDRDCAQGGGGGRSRSRQAGDHRQPAGRSGRARCAAPPRRYSGAGPLGRRRGPAGAHPRTRGPRQLGRCHRAA